MTWKAIYRTATGDLVSVGTVVSEKLPDGLASIDVGDTRPSGDWNPQTLAFEIPAAVESEFAWYIDVGPFFDRFGASAFTIASSEDAQVRGLMALVTPRKWIDLKRQDVSMFLDLLIGKGLITAEQKAAILTTPVTYLEQSALVRQYFNG